MRGMLTERINEIAKKMIGREINQIELRLIPYIQYLMVNEQKIKPDKIDLKERFIIQKWKKEGFFEGGLTGIKITKEFWDFMCEVLFESYVKPDGGEIEGKTTNELCWCGKNLSYSSKDGYNCPVHKVNCLQPKILDISQISIDIIGKNNIGCNIHKMKWCVKVEVTEEEHKRVMKKDGSAKLMRIKRNGEYVDVPIQNSFIGTKPKVKKWLKQWNLKFDDFINDGVKI